jgi:hypothetical protein
VFDLEHTRGVQYRHEIERQFKKATFCVSSHLLLILHAILSRCPEMLSIGVTLNLFSSSSSSLNLLLSAQLRWLLCRSHAPTAIDARESDAVIKVIEGPRYHGICVPQLHQRSKPKSYR